MSVYTHHKDRLKVCGIPLNGQGPETSWEPELVGVDGEPLALDFAQLECRGLVSATDAVVLPEPKPRAVGLLLIMSLIRRQDILPT